MNQGPFPPAPPPPPYGPPGGYPPPPGPPPQGASDRWVTPLMVIAGPGNVVWLAGVVMLVSSRAFERDAVAYVCGGLVPHALFTALFTWMLSKARPRWPLVGRIAAGSYITSGLAGILGLVVGVLAVGLFAAACGACKR